jgi:hypothetical protein
MTPAIIAIAAIPPITGPAIQALLLLLRSSGVIGSGVGVSVIVEMVLLEGIVVVKIKELGVDRVVELGRSVDSVADAGG